MIRFHSSPGIPAIAVRSSHSSLACGVVLAAVALATAAGAAPALAAGEETARREAPISAAEITARVDAVTGGADSCRAAWSEPLFYLWEFAQRRCEATACDLSAPSRIDTVVIAWFNYGAAPSEKPVRVFVMDDAGGIPGNVVWSADVTTTLLDAGATASVAYAIDPPLDPVGPGLIWFGHEEIVAGAPSSLFDGAANAQHASSPPPCGAWEAQTLGDYIQTLPVAPSEATGVSASADRGRAGGMRVDRLASPASRTLRFDLVLAEPARTRCELVTAAGERALSILDGRVFASGRHEIAADVDGMAPGVYFLRIDAGSQTLTRKVLLIR